MLTRIINLRCERPRVMGRFPRVAQKKAELTQKADGATYAALTALEHTLKLNNNFQPLENSGFFFEKIGASQILRLSGEILVAKGRKIYAEESSSLRSLLEFRGHFENQLRVTLEEIWELWNVSPVGYHMLNREGKIQAVNETEAGMLGYKAEEMLDRSIFDFILPSQREDALKRFLDKLQGREVGPTQDRIYLHRDGSSINMSAEDLLVKNQAGEVIGVKTVLIDISKMRRLQEQLYQLKKKEDLGELGKGVAHEFNNIICSIQLAVQYIRRHRAGENKEVKLLCDTVLDSCARAKAITGAILSYARLNRFNPETVELKPVMNDLMNIFSNQSQPPIEYKLALEHRRNIWGGQHQIYQSLLNLVQNAVDAMPQGGKLVLRTSDLELDIQRRTTCGLPLTPGKYIRISILDSGPGISAEDLPRIFDPFFTTKEPAHATGLGLSTVLGIMETHNGGIDVISKLNEGTESVLYFPAAAD